MSTLGEQQSTVLAMQRADLREPSARWVALHLSDFPESIPCGVFRFKAYDVLVWSAFHFAGGIFLLTFPQAFSSQGGKKKLLFFAPLIFMSMLRCGFESMGGAFYKQPQQHFVPRCVGNLFFKK